MMGFFMFYRSENIEAYDIFTDSLSELHRASKAFADELEAWPIVLSNQDGYYFDSIEFKDPLAGDISAWAAPNRLTRGQVPRPYPMHPMDACYHSAVAWKWSSKRDEHFKRGTVVSLLPVLRALGTSHFSGAFRWDDHVYFISASGARAEAIPMGVYDEAKMFSVSRGRSVSMW